MAAGERGAAVVTETQVRLVPTELGPARLHIARARRRERAQLVLGHGASGGVEAVDLTALAERLPAWGVSVVRVEQPWRVAGRRLAPTPRSLDLAWVSVVARLRGAVPLVLGGRSAGARVACRTAGTLRASGVVALAFPLHPPGRPDRSRSAELVEAGVPALVLQGGRDPFGTPEEVRAVLGAAPCSVREVAGADHGFAVGARGPLTRDEALELITSSVRGWVFSLLR